MATIQVNLSSVETYDDLPIGTYEAEVDKITWRDAKEKGKFPQFMVTYSVVDGDHLGRKSTEWLSLSPKAAFRLKKWFAKFGEGDSDNLEVDDDTNELTEPDLVGVRVIFKVSADGDRFRTELLTVEDDMSVEETTTEAEPETVEETAEETPAEAPPARKAARPKRRTLR